MFLLPLRESKLGKTDFVALTKGIKKGVFKGS
jgi:hypothetical protein